MDVRIYKGANIKIKGVADRVYANISKSSYYAVKPTDFHSLIPKLAVKIGDKLKAGSPVFFDKYNEKINFCSPVSGKVLDIVRGAKRRIEQIIIQADQKQRTIS